jgi:uncharacterized protein involved in type VI secretion and phage assembly
MDEQVIFEVLERIRDRFFGKYRGTVTEVEQGVRGRIKATVPAVLGEQPTGWCDPCVPYAGPGVGFAFLPEVGSGVWIEFEGGDVSYPIWVGCYWRDGELPPAALPTAKVIQTAAGHQILFDDEAGSIKLSDPNGNTLTLDSSGVTINRSAGTLQVTDTKVSLNDGALEVE